MSNEKIKVRDVVSKSLKELGLDEKWLQKQIAEKPGILGLAENMSTIGIERQGPGSGRLAILLRDEDTKRRYEVELQLGMADPVHIVYVLDRWGVERGQEPSYDRCAVVVAEEITDHFFDFIRLFNGQVPLIAIKLTIIKYPSGEVGLLFTRMLDEFAKFSSRETWEKNHGQEWVKCAKSLFDSMRPDSAKKEPHYTSRYIAMRKGGENVLLLKYRTTAVHVEFAYPKPNPKLEEELKNAGVEPTYYSPEYLPGRQYWFNVPLTDAATLPKLPAVVKRVLEGNNLGRQE